MFFFFPGLARLFLFSLASLAGIALSSAQMREGARQRAVLNERTRIAREMHDSLAQVLGAVHLRLRALETGVGTLPDDRVVAEVLLQDGHSVDLALAAADYSVFVRRSGEVERCGVVLAAGETLPFEPAGCEAVADANTVGKGPKGVACIRL